MAFKYPFTLTETLRAIGLPDMAAQAIERLQLLVRIRFGIQDPASLDQYVSRRDLIDSGVVLPPAGSGYQGSGAPIFYPPPVDGPAVIDAPGIPTGLAVVGATKTNILMWDAPGFSGFAYTEVWKASTDDLGAATLARTTVARVDADNIGASGITRYYWVRHVNQLGEVGPFNGVAGTAGTTGTASGGAETAAFDALVVARGVIVSALIGDAEISTAKIADASITSAKIISLAVSKLSAGALAVGQSIESTNWGSLTGWKINADGLATFNNVVVRGEIYATTGTFTGTLTAANFTGVNTLTGATFNDGTFIASLIRNASNTIALNLAATGAGPVLRVGNSAPQWDGSNHSAVEVNADGSAFFGNVVLSRQNIVASGRVYVDAGTGGVYTVIEYPSSGTTASFTGTYIFASPVSPPSDASGP